MNGDFNMMFNFNAYFSSGSAYSSKSFLTIYTTFIWILVIVNALILIKLYMNKSNEMENKHFLLITILWLNVWNYGELILTNVQLFSNLTVIVFADLDNIFLPFGLSLSILYFSKYLQENLMINKYSKQVGGISSQIVNFTFYVTFIPLLLLLGRFLLLPYLSIQGKNDVDLIIEVITIFLAVFVLILLLLALFQLHKEKDFISSKIARHRVKYYQFFIVSLFISLVFIIINLSSGLVFSIPQIINDLIAIPVYLGSTTGALSLYMAYVLPEWVQRRAGLIVSFG